MITEKILKKMNCPIPETLLSDGNKMIVHGIRSLGEKWIFTTDDPQIIVTFAEPVYSISYICDLGSATFKQTEGILYYKEGKEKYSDEKMCRIPFIPNKKIERKIFFASPVSMIRFDPADVPGKCIVKSMSFRVIGKEYGIKNVISEHVGKAQNGILVISHNLSETGAPMIACRIAEILKKHGSDVAVISGELGNGFLEDRLKENNISFMSLKESDYLEKGIICVDDEYKVMDLEKTLPICFESLFSLGYRMAIANTIVSGQYVKVLKQCGYKVVSLIHEMKTSIQLCGYYNSGIDVAGYADYIVFPNDTVKNDFVDLYVHIRGKSFIRAQGVYLKETEEIEEELFEKFMDEQNLSKNNPIIMSSGTCDMRKGIDFFVTSAIMMNKKYKGKYQFVWAGGFYDEGLQAWIEEQINKSGCQQQIHIIPFIKDRRLYRALLRRASVFWAMSREDPFPSTVLEAMKNDVPVIGFKGTGGIEVMLEKDRGKLIEGFDLTEVLDCTKELIEKPDAQMIQKAREYVKQFDYEEYVDFLEGLVCLNENPD